MIRSFLIFASLASVGQFADHATFKDCSRVNFCTTLRSATSEDRYTARSGYFVITNGGELQFEVLDASNNGTVVVSLTKLASGPFRFKIQEADSGRYQLQHVLTGEFSKLPLNKIAMEFGTFTVLADDYNITVTYSPFTMELYSNQGLLLSLGSRLNFDPSLDQAFAFDVSFPKAHQLYGIHEHADSLALQNTQVNGTDPYRLRNLDVAGYELNSPMALYGAVPVLYGHGPEATTGIFLHNAAEQWVEITNGEDNTQAYIMVESGALDLFVLPGPTPTDVVRQYTALTGTAHLPQLWALGYHQSRWNYYSQDDVKDVVANFTTYDFPLDAIWLDIDYTNRKKYFTWDSNAFSDPIEMQQNISAANKRLVTVIDPHIKVEQGYSVYDGSLVRDLFVKKTDGTNFEGDCWPGLSSYIDFLNPEARAYYADLHSYDNFPSSTPVLSGIWNDMNEPSVFDSSIENTLPGDAIHYGGVLHRDIHNIYGLLHTMSTHQGLIDRDNGTKRPFVLTRSHFAGTQRYAAIWTGENTADWGYLSVSYSQCLNANLLGIVFCGADVGGFSNNPTVELLQRWYQAGAWLPFYRAHSESSTQRREPFLFDDDVQEVIRNAIQLRYKHLPVWYTLFYEHTRNGDPIIRPLFYHYPANTEVYNLNDHLLVGSDILVRAVSESAVESVQVYFPGGTEEHWISISNSDVFDGSGFVDIPVDMEGIPIYYRRGSVIVRKDTVRLSSDEMSADGYTLYANLDANNKATGTVYLDDNVSFNYDSNKEYNYLQIQVESNDIVTLSKIDGDANSDDFDFIIGNIVVNSITKNPHNGVSGQYETKIYKRTVDGQLLRDLKLKADNTITFQFA